jgi:hypothetical protein
MRRHHIFKKKQEVQLPAQQEEAVVEELSIAIKFLNSIKPAQALQLYEEMIDQMELVEHINPRHVKPAVTTDELKQMTGHKDQDGKF